jgi:hypothetical protein
LNARDVAVGTGAVTTDTATTWEITIWIVSAVIGGLGRLACIASFCNHPSTLEPTLCRFIASGLGGIPAFRCLVPPKSASLLHTDATVCSRSVLVQLFDAVVSPNKFDLRVCAVLVRYRSFLRPVSCC